MSEDNWLNELMRRILFLPPQASTVAPEIDRLHYFVITVTMLGATAITVVGLGLLIKYRARGPAFRREDPSARPPVWAEMTVVGGLLGLFCLWWVIGFVQYLRLALVPRDSLDVYVTGKQWMWKFAYPDGQRSISILYVPTGRPVRVVLASRDVIHSFFVPAFRVKQDAVPGRTTTAWFTVEQPGTYPIYCTEFCGTGHSTMRGQVVALSPDDYARWLSGGRPVAEHPVPSTASAAPALTIPRAFSEVAGPRGEEGLSVEEYPAVEPLSLVRLGQQVAAQQGCLRCHTLDGTAHIGPTWAGLFGSWVPLKSGQRVLVDDAYVTESMMDPLVKVHEGFPEVMPSYHGFITAAETGALIELLRSLRDVPSPGQDGPPEGVPALVEPEAPR